MNETDGPRGHYRQGALNVNELLCPIAIFVVPEGRIVATLYDCDRLTMDSDDAERWGIEPTTRQGTRAWVCGHVDTLGDWFMGVVPCRRIPVGLGTVPKYYWLENTFHRIAGDADKAQGYFRDMLAVCDEEAAFWQARGMHAMVGSMGVQLSADAAGVSIVYVVHVRHAKQGRVEYRAASVLGAHNPKRFAKEREDMNRNWNEEE